MTRLQAHSFGHKFSTYISSCNGLAERRPVSTLVAADALAVVGKVLALVGLVGDGAIRIVQVRPTRRPTCSRQAPAPCRRRRIIPLQRYVLHVASPQLFPGSTRICAGSCLTCVQLSESNGL